MTQQLPVIVAGGGIGGLAAALALVRQGFSVKVLEQASALGEIGAGLQVGPNGFAAFDALGVGEVARSEAVYTDEMVMHDALDASVVGRIPTGEAFIQRFGNPYAVIHRADAHGALLEGADASDRIEVVTSSQVQRVEQDETGVTVSDAKGGQYKGLALIGADGVKSAIRQQFVGDEARVSGHVVYRAVVDKKIFRKTCNGTPPASGSGRITIWCTTLCAVANNTTWLSPFTAVRWSNGVCAPAAAKKC